MQAPGGEEGPGAGLPQPAQGGAAGAAQPPAEPAAAAPDNGGPQEGEQWEEEEYADARMEDRGVSDVDEGEGAAEGMALGEGGTAADGGQPEAPDKKRKAEDEPVREPAEETLADRMANRNCMQLGCSHYRRRAKIVTPCCNMVYWCRHCHNQVAHDEEPDPKKRHQLDRKAVREVVCGCCGLKQPKSKSCAVCGVTFGRYSCMECSFYDDDLSKDCFHCKDCGICRVGGRDNFFHCATCNCCYAQSLRDSHVCIENSMHANCPVCCEFLFDSVKPINIMLCGHTIHQECLRSLAVHHTFTCPVCMKSIMSAESMRGVWDELDREVAHTPMPAEYANIRVEILCNDCQAHSNIKFHVLGHKCAECGSYNTRRV
ncbi:hypothetical protein HXX76_005538 [Chlamydomonas incerta]|uniref:Uncharacterized protein n=1 Tax=Chlamydomonas incerta TaxID=51695 RepID=A0A835W299_CHLIN|nr:hypothetical protein HXX76_005538 [Chlamydomonas incerta]|eukprot:KAG2437922.1 hypothetical protein HXX76_005538 [Chlamydomonas incerta]